ncbi:MAG TPA: type II toxin-antitoxin system prevent-host-death family antitoxin [Terriglobia bacterium]|nr:type II toxin-antitoxin system prevent-host-death family antitoxin [Terriglobia bacterium]
MIEVGVRQLRNGLTRYLRLVEKGQAVLVTSRKRPVAMIKKPDRVSAQTEEEIVAALVAEGRLIGPIKPGPIKPFKPIKMRGKPLSQTIIEDRR